MKFSATNLAAILGLASMAVAAPLEANQDEGTVIPLSQDGLSTAELIEKNKGDDDEATFSVQSVQSIQSFGCGNPVAGLSQADCRHMSNIGMAGQGYNNYSPNGRIWIGNQGPNTFTFHNDVNVDVTVIVWYMAPGDYESSFMNVRRSEVSYTLHRGSSVTVSMANGVSGGFGGLYNRITTLSQYGQLFNTWGEFTSGNYATIDISREVNMRGNSMWLETSGGCHADMNTCAYQCYSGNTCGASGSYKLANCHPGSQPWAAGGYGGANPTGGCQGWNNGGHVEVHFTDN